MRVPSGERSTLRFNITPLIDVVFLLIIFFLVASHIVRSQAQAPVDLPDAVRVDDDTPTPNQFTVTVLADGTLSVGGTALAFDQLSFQLEVIAEDESRPAEVRIRGDKTSSFRLIEPILVRCAELGISDVKFAVTKAAQ